MDGPEAFLFMVLEQCAPGDLAEREQCWLDAFPDVLNTMMRAGIPPHGPGWSAKVKIAKMGHAVSEDVRAKSRAAMLEKWSDPAWRAQITAAQRAGWASKPESRARMREATKAWQARRDPGEQRAALSRASLARWAKVKGGAGGAP